FHQHRAVVKAHELRIGAGGQVPTDIGMRNRVEGFRDGRELVTADFGFRPQRDLVRRGRGRQEPVSLFRLKMLTRSPLGPTMSAEAVLLAAPLPRMRPSIVVSTSPAKQSSRTWGTARSTRALSRAWCTRAASM